MADNKFDTPKAALINIIKDICSLTKPVGEPEKSNTKKNWLTGADKVHKTQTKNLIKFITQSRKTQRGDLCAR